ncbi:hypothetical protein [Pseudonocardia sp. GCM10023141]|uniref:hypothetical protein n=1 Tax=Pseudonocardia sp. GCM10023141 TaxID=3252653 RepID=UPI00361655E6
MPTPLRVPPGRRRAATAALAWLAAVVVATAIGLLAVSAIGVGIIGPGQRPLDAAEVDRLLAAPITQPTPAPALPTAVSPPTPAPPVAPPDVLPSRGGTVLARCSAGTVEVVSANPAQGFRVHDEPGEDAGRVRFESGDTRVELRLSCRDGHAVADVRADG